MKIVPGHLKFSVVFSAAAEKQQIFMLDLFCKFPERINLCMALIYRGKLIYKIRVFTGPGIVMNIRLSRTKMCEGSTVQIIVHYDVVVS